MRESHKNAFYYAANKFTCWILLREPNPLSTKWMGRSGYIPKDLTCKGKTADNPTHPFSGLVVDPTKCPEAFKPGSRRTALKTWNEKFVENSRLPAPFTSVDSGRQKGLVKRNGMFIYADYDLMKVMKSNENGDFTDIPDDDKQVSFEEQQAFKEEKALFEEVRKVINLIIGIPLIQHGTEFMYDGVGGRHLENILWFGPGKRFYYGLSSMPEKDEKHNPTGGH